MMDASVVFPRPHRNVADHDGTAVIDKQNGSHGHYGVTGKYSHVLSSATWGDGNYTNLGPWAMNCSFPLAGESEREQ